MTFLDANVLLEVLLKRKKTSEVIELLDSDEDFCISIITLHLVYYFGLKDKYTLEQIDRFLAGLQVLDSGQTVYALARGIRVGNDFEDALQIATALENYCNRVITLDTGMYKNYNKLIKITLI